ncbi:MAG: CoA transferase [Flavobacteriales bacterium]|nr:CoA transferase [Flavobacteriales bacterium]
MLSHLKVIELASVLAGPDVGMFFAEMGAQVVKIENKLLNGDVTRSWKSANENEDVKISAYFSSVNWGKKHLFLNLNDDTDQQQVYDLITTADIVITNFKPGDDVKLGMDYTTLKSYNPTLIYGVINGYGSDSKRTAYDVVLQAETGFMFMNGTVESGPLKMPIALIDVLAAHQLKEGLLLALLKKEKTEKGSLVEVSLYDSAISSLKNQATNWLMNDLIPQAIGSLHPNIAPYGETFKTKDNKLLVLAIGNNKHFELLLTVLGAKKLLANKDYTSNQLRVINRISLSKKLSFYFKLQTKEKLMLQFLELNIPVGAINNLEAVFKSDNAQGLVLEEMIDGVNTKRVRTCVFKISN